MSSAPLQSPGDASPGSAQPVIVTLTREQSESKVIELRDVEGNSQGLLVREGGMAIFYTPERITELQRRAANPGPGKPFREAIDNAMRIARKYHEWRGSKS